MKNEKRELPILSILFFAALVLRLARLFDLDVWFDEAVLLFQIKGSFVDIWNSCKMDNFPPLYPWLLKIWHSVFPGENSLRFLSALMGSLTPPAAYLLGKELLDRKLGWLLGIACCISTPLIFYSQMIRMYTLFPFFACLSVFGFLRSLRTNHWKDWILVSIANVLGFYTFVFMLFLIATEILILLWSYRLKINGLARPLIVHFPSFILMLLWIVPLLQRYQQLQGSFWLMPVSEREIGELWLFLGTGSDFGDRYLLASLVNLPFLLGSILGIRVWSKIQALRTSAIIVLGSIAIVLMISLWGQPLFFKRYFLYLIPIYIGIVLVGWLQLRSVFWRRFGLVLTFLVFVATLGYYYIGYYDYHEEYVFPVSLSKNEKSSGHALSQMAELLREKISDDEIIVHFSNPLHRSFSFFPMLYYHNRSLPEYIYSAEPIPQYFGQQYLEPGEWIRTLDDVAPPPQGIWVVSLDPIESLFGVGTPGGKIMGWRWISTENLPEEIRKAGFSLLETIRFGRVVILHFRRKVESVADMPADNLNSAAVDFSELGNVNSFV